MSTITLPVIVPTHVTAALRTGETALFDADAREWFAIKGESRRTLGLHDEPRLLGGEPNGAMVMPSATNERRVLRSGSFTFPDHDLRIPLRPLTRADASTFRSRVAAMNPADHHLLDEMRRFYERGGVAS